MKKSYVPSRNCRHPQSLPRRPHFSKPQRNMEMMRADDESTTASVKKEEEARVNAATRGIIHKLVSSGKRPIPLYQLIKLVCKRVRGFGQQKIKQLIHRLANLNFIYGAHFQFRIDKRFARVDCEEVAELAIAALA